jgi:EpsI family protein
VKSLRTDFRFTLVVILLLATALVLQARSSREVIAPRLPLSRFPVQLGSWVGTDMTMDNETRDILGPGDFLLRDYQNRAAAAGAVNLFVAYFPSQRSGDTIHSPAHCLPGAGWHPVEATRVTISAPGRPAFLVNRYLIEQGQDRQLVFYWYQAHDRIVASEYWAKYYLITDSIRLNRSDGSLVRLTTPLGYGERPSDAEARLLTLVAQVVPLLDTYVPR